MTEFVDSKRPRVGAQQVAQHTGADQFVHVEGYGDNWRHGVVVEKVRDGDPDTEYPTFVDGARRCPPENVGGPDGFMDFLEAILDTAQGEHRAMLDWYGSPFDPCGLDEAQAHVGVENMARRLKVRREEGCSEASSPRAVRKAS